MPENAASCTPLKGYVAAPAESGAAAAGAAAAAAAPEARAAAPAESESGAVVPAEAPPQEAQVARWGSPAAWSWYRRRRSPRPWRPRPERRWAWRAGSGSRGGAWWLAWRVRVRQPFGPAW